MRRRLDSHRGPSLGFADYRRLLSLLLLLALVGLMIDQARRPGTWKWLVQERSVQTPLVTTATDSVPASEPQENLEAGPTDLDEAERLSARKAYEVITDRTPLSVEEMSSYWRFMSWSRRQSFAELQKRARKDVFFVHLWDQSEKYRGELIELRVHIRRILSHDAPENSAHVKTVYEAWGTTDDSKSYPYVLVFSELPEGTPMGADVEVEGIFEGYFLKTMTYQTFNARRAAPVLIGRLKRLASRSPTPSPQRGPGWQGVALFAIIALAIIVWTVVLPRLRRQRRKTFARIAEAEEPVSTPEN